MRDLEKEEMRSLGNNRRKVEQAHRRIKALEERNEKLESRIDYLEDEIYPSNDKPTGKLRFLVKDKQGDLSAWLKESKK